MKRYLFFLAAFLCALGIGLFWFNGFIANLQKTSYAAGKAECEAKQAKKVVAITDKAKEVQNVQTRKAAIVWSQPNSRLSQLIERMRKRGIGTADHYSENGSVSSGRE